MAGIAALLRFAASNIVEDATPASMAEPMVTRTLSRWAPGGYEVVASDSSLTAAALDELELLGCMFTADRKMRLRRRDGSQLLLLVESMEDSGSWCVLDITLSAQYPHNGALPEVRLPFGSVGGGPLNDTSFKAACQEKLRHVEAGLPLLLDLYYAAREWIDEAAVLKSNV